MEHTGLRPRPALQPFGIFRARRMHAARMAAVVGGASSPLEYGDDGALLALLENNCLFSAGSLKAIAIESLSASNPLSDGAMVSLDVHELLMLSLSSIASPSSCAPITAVTRVFGEAGKEYFPSRTAVPVVWRSSDVDRHSFPLALLALLLLVETVAKLYLWLGPSR